MSNPENERLEACYELAADIVADLFTNALKAMDKGYVGFVLDNRDIKLPVEEVEAITKLIADVQFNFGWCYCGECFGGEPEGGDDGED